MPEFEDGTPLVGFENDLRFARAYAVLDCDLELVALKETRFSAQPAALIDFPLPLIGHF